MRIFRSNDHSAQVAVGELFEIKLAATTSAGFMWKVSPISEVEVIDKAKYSELAPADLCGYPVWQSIRFRALVAGIAQLSLTYSRPWDKVPPADTYEIELTISK